MKKLFMFLMAAFLLVGIAACGGDEATTEAPAATTEEQVTDAPTTTEEIVTEDPNKDLLDDGYTYPTGLYNYKFAPADLRHTFMAAAERFLLETMDAGVPLFANGGFVMYSDRMQLPVEVFNPILGYAPTLGSMTEDDSQVTMADGDPGEAGDYTYRTTSTTNPGTFNQWLYDTSTDSDYMGFYYDAPYTYQFNSDKSGYVLEGSMLDGDPTPVDERTTDTGKVVSNTWTFTVKDDLEWFYHPDTDTSNLPTGHEEITAEDFVMTYKTALANEWFRAVSGGGDFLNATTGIVGAAEYADDPTEDNWLNVGITLDEANNEFTFEFMNEQSEWNVKYFIGSFVMTPVNLDLYEELGDPDDGGTYGISNTTVAYHGAYYVDYYEADKTVVFAKNPNYHTPTEYFPDFIDWQIINDAAVRFQEFIAGKLDAVGLPTEYYDDYKDDDRVRRVPGATTFRMMINGSGTVADQQRQFPGSTYVPEPILANQDFRNALYFAIDRQYLAETVLKTSQTQMYHFTDAYLVEAESGIPYRQTDAGMSVGEGLAADTNGYNKDAAVILWTDAIEALVDEGVYASGDTIELDFLIFSGSEAQTLLGNYIKTTFEETFVHDDLDIAVQLNVEPKDFPGIYYDYMMTGNFDLSIGGIAGSALDAASFLDVYTDDNRGGFTLNWGIDTSTANIGIEYSLGDDDFKEIWSFNSITAVMNGEKYILNGEEAQVPVVSVDQDSITPSGFDFSITEFDNAIYENFTYTVQEYDGTEDGTFEDVTSMTDVAMTSADVTVDDVNPYPYSYRVVVSYELVETGDVLTARAASFDSGKVLASSTVSTTMTTADITVAYNNSDRTSDTLRAIESVTVFEVNGKVETDVTDDVTVGYATDDAFTVELSDLLNNTLYKVVIESDDEYTDSLVIAENYTFEVQTESVFDAVDETVGYTEARFIVTLLPQQTDDEETNGSFNSITSVVVTDPDGTTVPHTQLRNIIDVENLALNTTYTMTVVSEDGYTEDYNFTTLSILESSSATVTDTTAAVNLDLEDGKTIETVSLDGTVIYDFTADTFTVNAFAFDLDTLTAETTYEVTIVAVDAAGNSYTEVFAFKTAKAPTV